MDDPPATSFIDSQALGEGDFGLVSAMARGHAPALRQLYEKHAAVVFTCCQRIIGNRTDAEQVLFDVFWEMWQRAAHYDQGRSSPRAYLLTLARSRSLDYLRRDKVRRQTTVQAAEMSESRARDAARSPVDLSIDAERAALIRDAIAGLDADQRQAIECAFYEGLSHAQMAAKLQEPLGTIKTRLRQGLSKLRNRLRRLHDQAALDSGSQNRQPADTERIDDV